MLPVRISAVKFGLFRALHLSQHVVGKALNRIEIFTLQTGVVRDVQASAIDGFVGSGLEMWGSMRRCATNDVNRRVVIHQLLAPCGIEDYQITDLHRSVDKIEHVLPCFLVSHRSVASVDKRPWSPSCPPPSG